MASARFEREPAPAVAGDHVLQCGPFDELHHQKMTPLSFLHAVKRGDVRMIERCESPGFTFESRLAITIGDERVEHDFEGDVAAEPRVAGAVDLAHPSFAERAKDFVHTESRTD